MACRGPRNAEQAAGAPPPALELRPPQAGSEPPNRVRASAAPIAGSQPGTQAATGSCTERFAMCRGAPRCRRGRRWGGAMRARAGTLGWGGRLRIPWEPLFLGNDIRGKPALGVFTRESFRLEPQGIVTRAEAGLVAAATGSRICTRVGPRCGQSQRDTEQCNEMPNQWPDSPMQTKCAVHGGAGTRAARHASSRSRHARTAAPASGAGRCSAAPLRGGSGGSGQCSEANVSTPLMCTASGYTSTIP